jgi:hypothetical protein
LKYQQAISEIIMDEFFGSLKEEKELEDVK